MYRVLWKYDQTRSFNTYDEAKQFSEQVNGKVYIRECSCIYGN